MKKLILILILIPIGLTSQIRPTYQIATLKYHGGGDWYANPTALPNLIAFTNKNIKTNIQSEPSIVEVGSNDILNYPFIHMTGHGSVVFNEEEVKNLRNYLLGGGFLHIDDNYGMDPFIRHEITKIFPSIELKELSSNHPIFNGKYQFKNGLPKIHQHDAQPAQAFGIVYEGRLVCLYTFQSDLGDGWEDPEVHNDSDEIRLKALQMGSNILEYVFKN
jgi:hypothetical protein